MLEPFFELTHDAKHVKYEPEVTYGKWSVQASKQTYTRGCNEVTLVWGSLRLVLITAVYSALNDIQFNLRKSLSHP